VAELSLSPGSQVWLSVKATELEVYTRGAQLHQPIITSPAPAGDGEPGSPGVQR